MGTSNNSDFQSPPLGDGGKIVLGFSGGLDTTYCVKYLTEEKGYEVHSIIVNTGGFTEDELKKKFNGLKRIISSLRGDILSHLPENYFFHNMAVKLHRVKTVKITFSF